MIACTPYREFLSQIILCIFIALAYAGGMLWTLMYGLITVAWFTMYHDIDVFSNITFTRYFVTENNAAIPSCFLRSEYGLPRLATSLLAQVVGAVLGGWISMVLVDSRDSAPMFMADVSTTRIVIVLLFTSFFHSYAYTFLDKDNTFRRTVTYGFLNAAVVYLNQYLMPGATGTINLDVGRMIGAKIYDSSYEFDADHFFVFILVPLAAVFVCYLHKSMDNAMDQVVITKVEKSPSAPEIQESEEVVELPKTSVDDEPVEIVTEAHSPAEDDNKVENRGVGIDA